MLFPKMLVGWDEVSHEIHIHGGVYHEIHMVGWGEVAHEIHISVLKNYAEKLKSDNSFNLVTSTLCANQPRRG